MPDIATEIFSGAGAEYVKSLGTSAEGAGEPAKEVTSEPVSTNQEVEQPAQGKESQPVTSGKQANEKTTEPKEGEVDATKNKGDEAAKNLRAWGEGWEKTAKQHEQTASEAKKQYTELIAKVEEDFGGFENLTIAAELYAGIQDEEAFDPETSLEWLDENMPVVAEKLVNHIAKQVVETATSTALKRTFGRELTQDEVQNVNAFLATGKTQPDKFGKFFEMEDIPEQFRFDANGDPLPDHVVDFFRHQNALIKKSQSDLESLRGRLDEGEKSANTEKATRAIEEYQSENFKPIDLQIEKLGLNKALEGETPEIKEQRELYANLVNIITLGLAGQDQSFQSIYSNALKQVAKGATSKVAQAKANDYGIRLRGKMEDFAEKAAEIISPLIASLTTSREAQVKKTQSQRAEISGSLGSSAEEEKKVSQPRDEDDPFSDVQAQVRDMIKSGRLKPSR